MLLSDKISKYCSYGESIRSEIASRLEIDNTPNPTQLEAMKYVATEIFDKVREQFGPLSPTSFFRSEKLNAATPGSSNTSQHTKGEAIDHYLAGKNAAIFKWVKENATLLDFDQMIWEYGTTLEPAWVHISKVKYRANRRQILRAYRALQGVPKYVNFDLF